MLTIEELRKYSTAEDAYFTKMCGANPQDVLRSKPALCLQRTHNVLLAQIAMTLVAISETLTNIEMQLGKNGRLLK